MAQLRPFHRSARVSTTAFPKLSVRAPAAVQAEADVHATLLNRLPGDHGLGVGWMAQLLPFHRSASVAPAGPPGPPPTATQNDADVHDTLPNKLPGAGL